MNYIYDKTPDEIYELICRDDPNEEYNYIIIERNGLTGKSWLASMLHITGYTVVELSKTLLACGIVFSYPDTKNRYILDKDNGHAVIVLNDISPVYKEKF